MAFSYYPKTPALANKNPDTSGFIGALGWNRTCDPLDGNQMLYPLSYKRMIKPKAFLGKA